MEFHNRAVPEELVLKTYGGENGLLTKDTSLTQIQYRFRSTIC